MPFNIFTPQILDGSGAKLSKTIYLAAGTYTDIPPAWTSMQAFENRFGSAGLRMLWDEVYAWARSPEKFFRNYSVRYLEYLFGESRQRYCPEARHFIQGTASLRRTRHRASYRAHL